MNLVFYICLQDIDLIGTKYSIACGRRIVSLRIYSVSAILICLKFYSEFIVIAVIFDANIFPGTLFSICLFSNYLKLDDTLLGIISCTSKIVASFAYAFARNDLEIYLGEYLLKKQDHFDSVKRKNSC